MYVLGLFRSHCRPLLFCFAGHLLSIVVPGTLPRSTAPRQRSHSVTAHFLQANRRPLCPKCSTHACASLEFPITAAVLYFHDTAKYGNHVYQVPKADSYFGPERSGIKARLGKNRVNDSLSAIRPTPYNYLGATPEGQRRTHQPWAAPRAAAPDSSRSCARRSGRCRCRR